MHTWLHQGMVNESEVPMLCCARAWNKPAVPTSESSSLSIEYITVATRMSSCIGILQEYAVRDDWEDYTDRLKQYFVANKMDTDEDAERRRAGLLTRMRRPDVQPHQRSSCPQPNLPPSRMKSPSIS